MQLDTIARSAEFECRLPNGEAFRRTLSLAIGSPVSRQWKGYWVRNEG